jgi:hypothetical protein
MQFLLIHWHCILPIAGIAFAMIFMRDKPKKEDNPNEARRDRISAPTDENKQF